MTKIALLEFRADDREQIEGQVTALHPDDREKMASLLRNENQFVTAYGELMVGALLASAGLKPRYEPRVSTPSGYVTPDWFIDGTTPVLCDVFTAGLERDRNADETALRELEARLSDGATGCMISIELPNAAGLDAGGRKRLCAEVHGWLASNPQPGSQKSFGPLIVELMVVGGDRVDVLTGDPMHLVSTPASIADNFDEKVKKYGAVGLPLIVAAVKHHRAEIDAMHIEDVLLGRLAYVSGVTASGQSKGVVRRLNDGVFEKRPSLRGAIYLEPHKSPRPEAHVWMNRHSESFPQGAVTADVLARLKNARL